MTTAVAPMAIQSGEEVVVIPRRLYESLAKASLKKFPVVKRTMKVPKRHEKFYDQLDHDLTASLRQHLEGKSYGPFDTADDAVVFLDAHRQKSGRK